MTWDRGFWVFTTAQGGTGYVKADLVSEGRVRSSMAGYILRYIYGGIPQYRGIPRWHPTWHEVTGSHLIRPLGRGRQPDFDTHNTSFIPFAPTENVARGAATAARGMGAKDKAEFVNGYQRAQGDGEVGLVATAFATPAMDLAFINETEIQIRGPLMAANIEIFRMSTTEHQALGNGYPNELRETRPGTPTEEQKADYRAQYGRLIP